MPSGFEVAQGEEENLDGADEDPSQAAVKDEIEQEDLCCGERNRKYFTSLKRGKHECISNASHFGDACIGPFVI